MSACLVQTIFCRRSLCYLTSVQSKGVASVRVHALIYLAVVLSLRWLTGNLQALPAYNWSVRSMGRAVGLL
eukprot:6197331-Pleurochrysis_carterae.AAC.3